MFKNVVIYCTVVSFMVVASIAYAAPVGNIAKPAMLKSLALTKNESNPAWGLIGEGEFDFVDSIGTDTEGGEADYGFLGGKVGVVISDKFLVYGLLGSAFYTEEFTDEGSSVKIESDKDLAWGLGATAIIYETEIASLNDSILRVGIDGKFRSSDIEVDKVIIDDVSYDVPTLS